jgi:hypothetical protein
MSYAFSSSMMPHVSLSLIRKLASFITGSLRRQWYLRVPDTVNRAFLPLRICRLYKAFIHLLLWATWYASVP